MKTKHIVVTLGLGFLSVVSVVFAQNLKSRVLIEKESIKVIGGETFPKDLDCAIYVGPEEHPHFLVEGPHGRITAARIDVNLYSAVSVMRKDTQTEAYALYLFSMDTDGKVFGLFDLNMDGQWDVRKTPTRKEKNFIWLRGEWFKVDKIDGLYSQVPTATSEGKQYQFKGTWALSQ
jgi:hypothetical protein